MSYAELTFSDRNRIKRWIQKSRLEHAIEFAKDLRGKTILDFGAGNGELCKLASSHLPAKTICYEPSAHYFKEAADNLSGLDVELIDSCATVKDRSVDVLFCLEVFEHLSDAATLHAIAEIKRMIRGIAVISVPIETGPPALIKGLFRITRCYGQFDSVPKNIAKATLGIKVGDRPFRDDMPGFTSYHMGFRHRDLYRKLRSHFTVKGIHRSPFKSLPAFVNSEIYFMCTH